MKGDNSSGANRYDVIIVGGGLVGASLACALAPLDMRIALIEAVPFRAASQPSYDDRTLALSASSCGSPMAIRTWLGSGMPLVQALPLAAWMPAISRCINIASASQPAKTKLALLARRWVGWPVN